MDYQQLRQWEQSLDAADSSPITANLPDADNSHDGDVYVDDKCTDGIIRTWLRVRIVSGNAGARWVYWLNWTDQATRQPGIGPHPDYKAVADKLFNGDANHFVGMLGVPYAGRAGGVVESSAWVLVSPKQQGEAVAYGRDQVRRGETRYEKSKEVHDVETGETRILP